MRVNLLKSVDLMSSPRDCTYCKILSASSILALEGLRSLIFEPSLDLAHSALQIEVGSDEKPQRHV